MATHHDNNQKPYKPDEKSDIPRAYSHQSDSRQSGLTGSAYAMDTLNSRLDPAQESALIRYNHLTYLLYTLSFFTAGILWIVPIVMNYVRRGDAQYTWLATHFDWQIKTFWYSILVAIIGVILLVIGFGGLGVGIFADSSHMAMGGSGFVIIGSLLFILSIVWHIYRIIRGWIALADKRPVP